MISTLVLAGRLRIYSELENVDTSTLSYELLLVKKEKTVIKVAIYIISLENAQIALKFLYSKQYYFKTWFMMLNTCMLALGVKERVILKILLQRAL